MKLEGQHRFEAPRELVWKALLDPEILSRTLPGCEGLERVGDTEFRGTMSMKIGPVGGQFQGTVTLLDLRPPEGYRLKLHGKGAPGFVDGQGVLELAESDGGTTLKYSVDAQVGGRIASVGQRLIESSAKVISRQALESLAQQINALHASANPPASSTGTTPPTGAPGAGDGTQRSARPEAGSPPNAARPAPPSQAQFAANFARGLFDELVPAERRPIIAVAGVVLVAVIVLLLVRACSG